MTCQLAEDFDSLSRSDNDDVATLLRGGVTQSEEQRASQNNRGTPRRPEKTQSQLRGDRSDDRRGTLVPLGRERGRTRDW